MAKKGVTGFFFGHGVLTKERKNERKMTRMTGNLRFYRNRDAAESVSKFNISKLKDFHKAV